MFSLFHWLYTQNGLNLFSLRQHSKIQKNKPIHPTSIFGCKKGCKSLNYLIYTLCCREGGIGYYADKSAPLNAFPHCSPQGPLQRVTLSKKLLRSPFVFYTSVYKQACAVGIKNKRCRLLDTFLLRWSLRRGRDSGSVVKSGGERKKSCKNSS